MDPSTVFVIATLMMLANGAVLGLVHRDLPAALQPGAASWRIATLLVAGGCILFAVQRQLPQGFVLPLANGLVMLGLTGYWQALRQFYGYADSRLLLVPAAVGTFGVFWFAAMQPNITIRILIVSAVWLTVMSGSVRVLRAQAVNDSAISRRVLAGIFMGVMAFTVLRVVYFAVLGISPGPSVLEKGSWMNVATPMIAAVLPVIGTTAFLLMCSERIRRQWEHAASTDYLTGLANRRTLAKSAASRFATLGQRGGGLALAVIDVDHFKKLNDRHGHDVGDIALKHVAARLVAACRDQDLAARQGGEEFVVLFDRVDAEQAKAVGERIREAVASVPFANGDQSLAITVSVGVAVQHKDDHDFDDLLRRADAALYTAKSGGRNRVELAVPAG